MQPHLLDSETHDTSDIEVKYGEQEEQEKMPSMTVYKCVQ